jgi:hypothetical protein
MRHWFLNSASQLVLTQLARPCTPYGSFLVADVHLYTGTGDCDGAVNGADGQPVKIPCSCPPDRATFVQVWTNIKHPSRLSRHNSNHNTNIFRV